MHRSETILHLIHIWSTLSVSHDEDPFICHQPFFAGPPNGHGNVNGVIKEYKLLSVLLSKRKYLCQSTAVVCMLTQPVCQFSVHGVQSCQGKELNKTKLLRLLQTHFLIRGL